MSRHSRIAACVLSLTFGSAVLAQTSAVESVVTKKTTKSGTIVSVSGNKVVLKEADGNHEYNLPPGFKVQVDGKDVGVDQLKPGMKASAVITDTITTRDVTVTKVVSGTVVQVAPGGIVIRARGGNFQSYNFQDPDGNDVTFVDANGREQSLRNVREGDRLSGTFVTKFPPQTIDKRSVKATASTPPPPPAPAAAPAAAPVVAAAPAKKKLPKTASPLPLVGLLALASAGIALTLRGARSLR
jgi:hypothetical protein